MSGRGAIGALALALCGCAARPPSAAHAPEPLLAVDARSSQMLQREEALDASLLGAPDCPRAREHLRALCELAEAICAERGAATDPSAPEQDPRCADARARCTRATERTEDRCPHE